MASRLRAQAATVARRHIRPIERPRSLTESALVQIRDAIVAGELGLGQPLSERALSEMLHISKTPVREALARLRLEGLVRIYPQRGACVFSLSAQEVVEMCELRLALESAALRLAVERGGRRSSRISRESSRPCGKPRGWEIAKPTSTVRG